MAALFNLVAGNSDAHGKNFSLLYRPEAISFAPLYDFDVHGRRSEDRRKTRHEDRRSF